MTRGSDSVSLRSLRGALADFTFSDVEEQAREVREYAESTQRFTPAQVDQVVEAWRAFTPKERAVALSNMREQKKLHAERIEKVMESVKQAQEAAAKAEGKE